MKSAVLSLAVLTLAAPLAHAGEFAPVVAKSEIVREVPVSRQVCHDETVEVGRRRSAGGAVLGGVAGAVLGHTVGKGSGKAAATAAGAIAGAVVGDRLGNQDRAPATRQEQRCQTVEDHEDQVVGYRVTYEFAGRQYTARMSRDPGDRVEVRVSAVEGDGNDLPAVSRDDRDGPHDRRR